MKLFSNVRLCTVDGQTLLTLMEIAKQLKRLADSWEGNGKSEKTAEKVSVHDNVMQVVWTDEEDKKLLSIVNLIGPRWVKISETGILPGRTPAAMSARYNNVLKNRK